MKRSRPEGPCETVTKPKRPTLSRSDGSCMPLATFDCNQTEPHSGSSTVAKILLQRNNTHRRRTRRDIPSPSPLSSPLPIVPALTPGSSANATLPMDMAPPSSSPPAQSGHSAIWAIWASYELRFKTADVWMLPYRSRDTIFDILWDILRNKQLIPDDVFEPDQQFSVRTEVKYCGKRLDIAATTVRSADHHALELDLGANICLIVEVMAAAGAGERLYLDSFQVRNVNKELRDNAEGSATAGIPVGTTLILIGFLGPFFTVYNWRYGRMSKDNGFWDIRTCRGQRKLQRVLASFRARSEIQLDKPDNLIDEDRTAVV